MRGVHECLEAAETLAAAGIDAEVVDLRTLRPFDHATVLASVEKTNRIVVVEEGTLTGGWAGEDPSVSTLYALVQELRLTMGDLFASEEAPPPPGPPRLAPAASPLVTPEHRAVINLASGVAWERLTPSSDPTFEFLHVVYEVGSESCPEDSLVTHGGKEYGYAASQLS